MRLSRGRAVVAAAMMGGLVLQAPIVLAQGPGPSGGSATPAPSAEAMSEARSRYKRGLELYNDKNYEAARVEFSRAYQLAPSNLILYNIGVCNAQLNDYVAAIATLERYLKEGGAEVPADRRTEVEKLLSELRPRTGRLLVTSNVTGATVQVDDVSVCEEHGVCVTPMPDPLPVNPGRRRVTISKAGWIPQTRSIVVAGSETARLDIVLSPTTVQKNVNVAPYVAWGVTGLFAIGAGVTGYLALKNSSDLNDKLNQLGVSPQDLSDTRSRMRTFGVTADILTGCAIVAGGVALYLTITSSKSKENPAGAETQVGFGPGSLLLKGSF